MFKKTITFLLSLFSIGLIYAQHTVEGVVVGETSQHPMEFVNVLLVDGNDAIVSGGITDAEGKFSVKIDQGEYTIKVERFGTILFTKKLSVNQKIDLGKILVKEVTELDNVVVTGKRPTIEAKPDRLVFNIENTLVGKGAGTAMEALKATPGLVVKQDNVSIIGKSGVMFLINDRPVQMSAQDIAAYLETISAADIKSVEVITMPPAKYDAQGNVGIVNIVLKKPKEDSWSNQVRTTYTQATYPSLNLGNTFNYNRNKIQLSASIDVKKGNEQQLIQSHIFYPTGVWRDTLVSKNKEDYISGRLGLDYKITEKSTVGFSYRGSYKTPDTDEHSRTYIYDDKNSNVVGHIANDGAMKAVTDYNAFNLHYLQDLDTLGRNLSVDVDYFTYNDSQNREFSTKRTGNATYYEKSNNIGRQNVENYSAKFDVEYPLSWLNLSYGAKVTRTKTRSKADFYNLTSGDPVLDPARTDNFEYTEDIQALYVQGSKDFNEQWQAQLGVRYEHTQTVGVSGSKPNPDTNRYGKFFPTVYVNYIKDQNNIFNLSYDRRMYRPAFWKLNPFRFYLNANSYAQGNPNLRPAIVDEIEFKYILKGMFITNLFVYFEKDKTGGQVIKIDPTNNAQIATRENYLDGYSYGLRQTVVLTPFDWWQSTNMFAVYSVNLEAKKGVNFVANVRNGWTTQFLTNNVFSLDKEGTWQAEATFMASSRVKEGVYENAPNAWLDLGVSAQLMDRKLQLSATVSDVFKSSTPDVTTYTSGIKQVYNIYNDNRYFALKASYRFGNKKIRVKERDLGNEDELDRNNK